MSDQPTSNHRTPVYYFAFNTEKKPGKLVCKGIQFVTAEMAGDLDPVEFLTLVQADIDGHLDELLQCWGGYDIVKELASLPPQLTLGQIKEIILRLHRKAKENVK